MLKLTVNNFLNIAVAPVETGDDKLAELTVCLVFSLYEILSTPSLICYYGAAVQPTLISLSKSIEILFSTTNRPQYQHCLRFRAKNGRLVEPSHETFSVCHEGTQIKSRPEISYLEWTNLRVELFDKCLVHCRGGP